MKYDVTVYPWAVVDGIIEVPETITEPDEIRNYICENWDKIDFAEPEVDHENSDFTFTKVTDLAAYE